MKRIALCLVTALLALLVSAPAASAFGWKDVVKMRQAGIADSLILQKIEYSGTTFHLGADEMETLKDAGVSDEVISAMLRTEAVEEGDDGYDDGYAHPYDVYPHGRVYVGFGLRYDDPFFWYDDPYWYPRYRSDYRPYYRPYYRRYGRSHYGRIYSRPYGRGYGDHRYRGSAGHRADAGRSRGTTTRYRSHVTPRTSAGTQGYRTSRPGSGGVSGRTTTRRR